MTFSIFRLIPPICQTLKSKTISRFRTSYRETFRACGVDRIPRPFGNNAIIFVVATRERGRRDKTHLVVTRNAPYSVCRTVYFIPPIALLSEKQNVSTANNPSQPLPFAVPYLVGVLVQLPLLVAYFLDLGQRPHYGLYLIGLLATVLLAALNWPFGKIDIHRGTAGSSLLLILAVVTGVTGAILVQPWYTVCSFILLISSYFAATSDKSGAHTLFRSALPLLAFLRPPLDWDLSIATRIQNYSVDVAGRFMTLLSPVLGHKVTDTAYLVPGKDSFPFSDSLVGIASVFSLIFIALLYIAVTRRSLFQSVLLIVSCFIWSAILNTTYLLLLPVLGIYLEVEIEAGTTSFNMLRVLLLLGTALMVISTGQFFRFVFGPVDPDVGRSYNFGRFITAVWNGLFASEPFINETGQVVGRKPQGITKRPPTMIVRWAAAITLAVVGVIPLFWSAQIYAAAANRTIFDLTEGDIPSIVDNWAVVEGEFELERFDGSNVYGARRATWKYQTPSISAKFTISQPFQMWHELTDVYRIKDWEVVERLVEMPTRSLESDSPWSYVESTFKRESGEKGLLLFAYFDTSGNLIQPPDTWGSIGDRVAAASIKHSGPMIQVALFRNHFFELTDESHSELVDLFLQLRDSAVKKMVNGQPDLQPAGIDTSVQSNNSL